MIAGACSFVNTRRKSAAFIGGWRDVCCTPINRRADRVTTAGLLRPYGKAMIPAGCHRAHDRRHFGQSGRHRLKLLRLRGIIQHCVKRNFARKLPHHPWYFTNHKKAASEICCQISKQVKQRRKQGSLPEAGCANLRINMQTGPDARKSASGPKRSVNTWFSCCRGFRQKHR